MRRDVCGWFTSLISNVYVNMNSTSIAHMNELIQKHWLFRGFDTTLRSFEYDLKLKKKNMYRVDKKNDQLNSSRAFIWLDRWNIGLIWIINFRKITIRPHINDETALTRKYELILLRFYADDALQSSMNDKAFEFFENYASELQSLIQNNYF